MKKKFTDRVSTMQNEATSENIPGTEEPAVPDSRFDFTRDWDSIPLFMDEISLDSVENNNEDLLALKELMEHEVWSVVLPYPPILGHSGRSCWRVERQGKSLLQDCAWNYQRDQCNEREKRQGTQKLASQGNSLLHIGHSRKKR